MTKNNKQSFYSNLKIKISKIFKKVDKNYILKRKINSIDKKNNAYFYFDRNNSQRVIFALIFSFIFIFLISYYIFLDFKQNIMRNNISLKNDEISFKVENPVGNNKKSDYNILKYEIKSGDNIWDILIREVNVSANDAYRIIKELNNVYKINSLKVGQELFIKYRTEIEDYKNKYVKQETIIDELKLFSKDLDENILVLRNENNEYYSQKEKVILKEQFLKYKYIVENGLYLDGVNAGIPPALMIELINYFSFDFDFQRDIQKGDELEILFNAFYTEQGKKIKNGEVLYARIKSRGNNFNIYKYNSKTNGTMYFNEYGISSKKSLLKTPINGARISSNFSSGRKHPILGYTRAHRGIDFAAPQGTPFFAAGNGTIIMMKAGYNGGHGNYIRIKHNNTYSTAYAHISRFAKGMYVGKKVKQGDVIAYVGSTGLSTGPHLHYEILYKGKQINPNSIKSIPNIRLMGQDLINFNNEKNKIDLLKNNLQTQN